MQPDMRTRGSTQTAELSAFICEDSRVKEVVFKSSFQSLSIQTGRVHRHVNLEWREEKKLLEISVYMRIKDKHKSSRADY